MELDAHLNERVVLTTKSEVCYAGIARAVLTITDTKGLLVQLDERSGLSVWCPETFIKEVLVVPIPRDGDN